MLILTRNVGESIVIDGGIKITVGTIQGNQVRVMIDAPRDVTILREELVGRPRKSSASQSREYEQTEVLE
jgi:carbon storage regulator